ncbi:inorganic phosphate transporter [Anaeroselena agilis]|uniref:Anion permease n=1 Tax=Anaeroselena agilis TaxID=3063788 RepID=A0ABU3NSQ7_9FIRM|nr:anion permease [Selenomonadales bacterium 4137-cl]
MFWDMISLLVVCAAFLFLLTNGLHDASSVVATMIGCGAAQPLHAVAFAGVLELLGAIFGGSAVAYTVAKMIEVAPGRMLLLVLLVALVAATAWNVFTWQVGLPSSSTHALVGGLIGSVWIAAGPEKIVWGVKELLAGEVTGIVKVIVGLVISPLGGFAVAYLMQVMMEGVLKNTRFATTNRWLKRLQWLMVGTLAYSHGANDTQKVMGVIILALMAAGQTAAGSYDIPAWLRMSVAVIMFVGILCGGWSIMKTLGRGIFTLRPIHSFDSLFAAGTSLFAATALGAPVSTTHLVVGSIIGVGAADEYRMVNWRTGQTMVVAWCVTIPASALLAAILYLPLSWLIVSFWGGF